MAAAKMTAVCWMKIQGAEMKIEPAFGPPREHFEWQRLELPRFAEEVERRLGRKGGEGNDEADESMTGPDLGWHVNCNVRSCWQ
jgi:hypothetical protein